METDPRITAMRCQIADAHDLDAATAANLKELGFGKG